MKLLLDTHTALWCFNEHEKLSGVASAMLKDYTNSLFVSMVSVWEIAIKTSLGKVPEFEGGSRAFLQSLQKMPVNILPLSAHHIGEVEILPFIHRDPFDRLLVATAKTEGMTILTADDDLRKYDVLTAW